MFDNLKTDNEIEESGDSLGMARTLDSDAYPMKVDIAYFDKSKGGAMSLNLVLKNKDAELKQTLWITGGDAKGNKNFYMDSKGDKQYLPGFNQANALCLLTVGKELAEVANDIEDKVIGLWSFDDKKEVPTKVQMLMPLLGTDITVGVLKQTVDKQKKDGAGDYQNTGETREENEIDKMFRTSDHMTVTEIRAKATDSVFYPAWVEKWKGKVKNKAKGSTDGATAGAPAGTTPAKSLFS